MWLNYIKKQRRDSQCNGKTGRTSVRLSRNPQGRKFGGITPEIFFRLAASQSPSKIWRAAAAGKIATRRLISRIILESVVNASSHRRRGLLEGVDLLLWHPYSSSFWRPRGADTAPMPPVCLWLLKTYGGGTCLWSTAEIKVRKKSQKRLCLPWLVSWWMRSLPSQNSPSGSPKPRR